MKTFKQLISEGSYSMPGDDMTVKELKIAINSAKDILDMIDDGVFVQRWQISAIVKASDELASVCASMSADDEDEEDNYEDEYEEDEYEYPSMYGESKDMDWEKDSAAVKKSKDPKFISKMIDKWGARGGAFLNHPALKEETMHESAVTDKDTVLIHSHKMGTDTGKYGIFNIEKATATQITVYDDKMKRSIKFNLKTKRGIGDADDLMIKKVIIREDLEEEKKRGLWANIHARRKKGLPPKKPGEEGYPKTLKIDESPLLGPSTKEDRARSAEQSDREYAKQMMFKSKWKKENPGKAWPGYSKAGFK